MGLKKYKSKRNLTISKEPAAKKKAGKGRELRFVVQEHDASHLHYDLRLEVDGVLKSWAVPKGPSTVPNEKRLAVMVEDHPYDYQYFEGVIPEGYGAGTVVIWDKGTYDVHGLPPKESEKEMRLGLKKGQVHFSLHGKKLKGEFLLVRLKNNEKNWLLFKKREKEEKTSTESVTTKIQKAQLTNLQKIFWPKEKITKGDLLDYYKKIAPYILPYLKDRPESLSRFPDGIDGIHFFQKNLKDHPDWVRTKAITHKNATTNYLIINDLSSLLYAINLGCIELHPFFSRAQSLNNPDFLVLDLDPEAISFSQVIKVALEIHAVLEELSVPNFCKTSGSRGMHILVPLKAKYSYEVAKNFALLIAQIVHKKLPKITSLERKPKNRQKKVYIDCYQNNPMQTIACPYSVRAKPGAPVSTPLLWSELEKNKNLDPRDFNIFNVPARLKKKGDILKPLLSKSTNIVKLLPKAQKILDNI